jgi:hypothetical protein
MRKRLLMAALLGSAMLVAGAVPAFTADNGTITGTVSVPAPPAPCIELSTSTLDFGTQPFAASGASSQGYSSAMGLTNCSTALERYFVSATNAAGPSGGWALTQSWGTCDGQLNRYGLASEERPEGRLGPGLRTTPIALFHTRPGVPDLLTWYDPGETDSFAFRIGMPCIGSDGAGESFSFTIALLALVS